MARLPRITAAQAVSVLMQSGFTLAWQSGSHRIFKNTAGKRVTMPFHAGKILHPKVFRSILHDSGLVSEDFV